MLILENALKITGWMELEELTWLAEQAQNHSKILELGSYMGRSTRVLCDNTTGLVTAVDLWKQEGNKLEADYNLVWRQFQENLKEHIDTKLFPMRMSTDEGIEILEEGNHKFDFIFIDAEHTYEQGLKDIAGCAKLLTDGGLLSGHDFLYPGIEKALYELYPRERVIVMGNMWYIK